MEKKQQTETFRRRSYALWYHNPRIKLKKPATSDQHTDTNIYRHTPKSSQIVQWTCFLLLSLVCMLLCWSPSLCRDCVCVYLCFIFICFVYFVYFNSFLMAAARWEIFLACGLKCIKSSIHTLRLVFTQLKNTSSKIESHLHLQRLLRQIKFLFLVFSSIFDLHLIFCFCSSALLTKYCHVVHRLSFLLVVNFEWILIATCRLNIFTCL